MCSGRSCASCGCCYYSCPALAFVEAMSVLSAFFFPSSFLRYLLQAVLAKWDLNWIHKRLSFLLIGLSVLPNKGDCREPCPCTVSLAATLFTESATASSELKKQNPCGFLSDQAVSFSHLSFDYWSGRWTFTAAHEYFRTQLQRLTRCWSFISPWPPKGLLSCARHLQGTW